MRPEPRQTDAPIPPQPDPEPAKTRIDLSLTQVLGGALAAMTAAFLGSRLSVAGTVIGAALASIVAAVAGSLYTASLRTTRERVRTVWQGRVSGSAVPATVETTGRRDPGTSGAAPAQPSAPAGGAGLAGARLSWRKVLVAAFAAFALAAAVLTGIELATGSALSGGSGTTVSQVTEPQPPAATQDATPTAAPTSASPSPTGTATPSSSPSATAAASPSPAATSTGQPSAAPSSAASTATAPTTSPTSRTSPSGASATPQG
jgi:hypothetical protein